MDIGGFDPTDMKKYLGGVNWPADKNEVAKNAEGNGAPQGMLEKIRSLGGGEFSGPEDVISKLRG